jgi:hypothetical protein
MKHAPERIHKSITMIATTDETRRQGGDRAVAPAAGPSMKHAEERVPKCMTMIGASPVEAEHPAALRTTGGPAHRLMSQHCKNQEAMPKPSFAARRFAVVFSLLVLLCAGASAAPAQAQAPSKAQTQTPVANKRLILKDGGYQIVTQYKVQGDRVRYYSAEREQWEEIPSVMVDWPATEQWAKDHAPGAVSSSSAANSPADAEAAAIDKEEQEARAEQTSRTPEVLPGLRLPDETGVWVLDTYRSQPELVKLVQNSGDLNPRTGHNVTRGELDPGGRLKRNVQFPGAISKVQLHVDQPVFYVSLSIPDNGAEAEPLSEPLTVQTHAAPMTSDKDSFSSPSSRYVIVRVENNMRRDYRVLDPFSLAGKQGEGNLISTTGEILPGKHWMKLTPNTSLTIGDYALMEILGPGEANLSLWDFRIDPQGPDNMDAIIPLTRSPQ